MPIDLKKYERLKAAADEAKQKADRSAGVLEQLNQTLLKEFGVKDIKQAKAKLNKLEAQQTEAEHEYEQRYAEFVEKYPELEDED